MSLSLLFYSRMERNKKSFSCFGSSTTLSFSISVFIYSKNVAILLKVKEHNAWILNGPLDTAQKGHSLSAVNQTVIICQSDVHHWANSNLEKKDLIINKRKHDSLLL